MCVCLLAQDSQDTHAAQAGSWGGPKLHCPPQPKFPSQGSCLSCAYSGNSLKLHSCRRCCHCFGLLQFFRTVWSPKHFIAHARVHGFHAICPEFSTGNGGKSPPSSLRKCCTSFDKDIAVGRCLPF